MLTDLHVGNYVLIDSLDISFPGGLVIITGETGAGKSIILGALSLLMGARADASAIGPRGDSCIVEGNFTVDDSSPLKAIAEAADLDWDGGRLIVRRMVSRSGRSRAFVNDSPVPVSLLQEIGSHLVDIHSQHQTLLLGDQGFRMRVLDSFAGVLEETRREAALWADLQSLKASLGEVENRIRNAESEREYSEARLRALSDAKLADGELEELEAEQKRLANAEEIKLDLEAVMEMFSPSGPEDDRPSLSRLLKESSKMLGRVAPYMDTVSRLADRIDSARLELEDVESEIGSLSSGVEASPDRLQAVEDRLSLLYSLMKKHGVATVSDLISVRDSLAEVLSDTSSQQERREELKEAIARVSAEYGDLASRLHSARVAASGKFASEIEASMRFLELEKAIFKVSVEPSPDGPSGRDMVRFMFSSTGKESLLTDVAKAASGGELSRIMLSLKSLMARFMDMPTMFFDEIDTGVSGSAADRMGSMICSMGDHMQVFAITHLPQVAAKGLAHYLVTKDAAPDGGAVTSIARIGGQEREMEIARMLSGATVTDAAVENARVLLGRKG